VAAENSGSGAHGTLVVTGGARGIGAAVCRQAAAQGWAVAVNYRARADAAQALVQSLRDQGASAAAIEGDTADPAQVEALFREAAEALGPIRGLVNNAGITGPVGRLDETDPETIRRVVDVNLTGALYAARAAVRHMSPRQGGGGGVIVNMSSAAATLGAPDNYVWYAATKGAIDTLTLGLAHELAGDGIRVNGVAPGIIETDLHAESSLEPDRVARVAPLVPMQRAGTPAEVAEAVCWLLAEETAGYVTGTTIRVSGGR
jgi:NAD(P)-dependent dehydrogenase (short-subunit alcohol dehydrogenase family)